MKVFISGPMSGYDDFNRPAFMEAEKMLKEAGFDVFNPAWLDVGNEWNKGELLAIDICALSHCDAIFLLKDWDRSTGAQLESAYSIKSVIPTLIFACVDDNVDECEWDFSSTMRIAPNSSVSTVKALLLDGPLTDRVQVLNKYKGDKLIPINFDEPIVDNQWFLRYKSERR